MGINTLYSRKSEPFFETQKRIDDISENAGKLWHVQCFPLFAMDIKRILWKEVSVQKAATMAGLAAVFLQLSHRWFAERLLASVLRNMPRFFLSDGCLCFYAKAVGGYPSNPSVSQKADIAMRGVFSSSISTGESRKQNLESGGTGAAAIRSRVRLLFLDRKLLGGGWPVLIL